jgi:hypothetical protein
VHVLGDRQRRRQLLYSWYTKWDQRNISPNDDPQAPVDCTARLASIDRMVVDPIGKRFVHRFPDDALKLIRKKDLDMILRFGFNILRGDILTAAQYGVWSYHHGDNDYYRGGPAHFWELHEGNPISAGVLQRLTEDLDSGLVLCKGYFATQQGFSLVRNRVQPY